MRIQKIIEKDDRRTVAKKNNNRNGFTKTMSHSLYKKRNGLSIRDVN
ncbi:hypothetical protein [Methanolobus sp.]|nr:hypothetical protein [Methanolobus sp.]